MSIPFSPISLGILSRRQLFQTAGVASAGALRLPAGKRLGTSSGRRFRGSSSEHVFSFIGELSSDGAFVSSVVRGGLPLDLAVSRFPDLSEPTLAGVAPPSFDDIYRHDLLGILTPGTQYYARLVARGQMFGRTLTFRTLVAGSTPSTLRIALVSCQRNADLADPAQLGWSRIRAFDPDLVLHGGDFGYWGGSLSARDPYPRHVAHYAHQIENLPVMRDVFESAPSLIEVSDHETSTNDGDNWQDETTAHALEAYFRMMPFRSFDDATRRSRFLTRKLGPNLRIIAPDFRSLDRCPGSWPDDDAKRAFSTVQFELFRGALRAPEAVKIVLFDPGCAPAHAPEDPSDERMKDKWCNYQNAYQEWVDVVRNERTVDGKPILVDVWSGDRHMLGITKERDNWWGPFDVLTSSGIDQDANGLKLDETYTVVYGNRTPSLHKVKLHMEIELTDDLAGTVTRTVRGVCNSTGTIVMSDQRSWNYVPRLAGRSMAKL